MHRRPSTQDITWLLDLNSNGQLNLDPPYQRRSVWTLKDKQFFLDTIFRNYPSPAIFLHKTVSAAGKATYHVVDGKQRTQTILDFVGGRLRMSKEFGDTRLDGRGWPDILNETDLKQKFWNYQLTVEQIDFAEGSVVNEVFDRLNRNARRLTSQELRHAKYEGWLISQIEKQSTLEEWVALGVVTKARAKRMADCQFISELMQVLLEQRVVGFDQDQLDQLYAKYDDPSELPDFNEEFTLEYFESVKNFLLEMEESNDAISRYARTFGPFYSLWAVVCLGGVPRLPADHVASQYADFMQLVSEVANEPSEPPGTDSRVITYYRNSRGASTDEAQRRARHEALSSYLGYGG